MNHPQIEIAIEIEIGKLPGVDFDHDFDFDTDSELQRFEIKPVLRDTAFRIDTRRIALYFAEYSFD